MLKVFRQSSSWARLFLISSSLVASTAVAQVSTTQRQLDRIDIGISGVGEFTKSVEGTNYQNVKLTEKASNTLGALVTFRYTKSPWVGFEGNYGYARYTENFTSNPAYLVGGAQTKAAEYTLGYVAHTPQMFGVQPFVAGGLGTIAFTPTPFGGQGLPEKARMAYYYSVGAEDLVFSKHFGLRAQFRQLFFLAPDFGQNYLTIKKHTVTSEPTIGFFVRF